MKILILADPLNTLNPTSDTGLMMMRESLKRGHEVFWSSPESVSLWKGNLYFQALPCLTGEKGVLPETSAEKTLKAQDLDSLWIRKDPPFDPDYVSLCWLLSLWSDAVSIINPPELLLRYHEKMIPFEAWKAGYLKGEELADTWLPGSSPKLEDLPQDFPAGETIIKPYYGHGGRDIQRFESPQEAIRNLTAPSDPPHLSEKRIIQPFLKEILKGDRRAFFLNGEYQDSIVRVPQGGSIISNLSQGGKAVREEPNSAELDTLNRLGAFLKTTGLIIAGADLIEGKVTEVNVTAPTGFHNLLELGGPDLIKDYVDFAEKAARL